MPIRALVFSLVLVALNAAAAGAADVTTIAGSGWLGITDGPALGAAFVMPAAVAVGADGSVYVADAGAQTIRRIRGGRVETIAGRSEPGAASDDRIGGYRDGRAADARFSRPIGLAIGPHGTVYVADAGNDCIRKIENGVVTTLAGSTKHGKSDGPGARASFENLRALTIDDDGTLYAADYGVGIRKIAPSGAVTTLDVPSAKRTIVAVAARGSGRRLILAYADSEAVHTIVDGKHQAVRYDDTREPGSEGQVVGFADAIAIVNENTLVVCDVATEAVRLVRLPAPPFLTDTMTRALAGGVREGGTGEVGFADGPSANALVTTPLGVAVAPGGSIVVADAGNRRVRRIAHVDARETVLPDLSNLEIPRDGYGIAFVGNSYAFFNVLWPESIPGTLEAELGRDARRIGLGRPPHVLGVRIDAAPAAAQTSLVDNVLGDGQVRLVVLLANSFGPADPKMLRALERSLARTRAKLLLVFIPQGNQVSPLEFWKANVTATGYQYAALRAQAAREESYYHRLSARSLLLLDAMEAQEALPDRRDLFYSADHHLTVFGTRWVAHRIVEELEAWRPWL